MEGAGISEVNGQYTFSSANKQRGTIRFIKSGNYKSKTGHFYFSKLLSKMSDNWIWAIVFKIEENKPCLIPFYSALVRNDETSCDMIPLESLTWDCKICCANQTNEGMEPMPRVKQILI